MATRPAVLVLLHVLAVAVASPPFPPYQWSYAKIIRALEGPSDSVDSPRFNYQLISNLPTVKEAPSEEVDLLPQPERCDNCSPGTTRQPADAGRVNSLMRFEGSAQDSAQDSAQGRPRRARALPGQFPWHVSLLYRNTTLYSCSGSLLSSEWVLTAANCVSGFDYMMVMLGSYRPRAEHERFRELLNATHFVVHPGYRRGSPRHDIAVVKLPTAVRQLNSFVLPVRLPSLNNFLTTYTGRTALLSSWGANFPAKPGTFNATTALGCLVETVLANEECAKSFGSLASSATLCTTTTHFTDGSLGDSGAPLVVQEGGLFVQVGVLSFASAAGFSGGHPAGYTRVTSYLWWIQNATGIAPGPDVDVNVV